MHLFERVISCAISAVLLTGFAAIAPVPDRAFAMQRGTCGENVSWFLDDDGLLTLYGSGATVNFASAAEVPWRSERDAITSVSVGRGITKLGNYMFAGMTALTAVSFPDTMLEIGTSAFSRCTALTAVALPDTLQKIDPYAFYQSGLTDVSIPAATGYVGYQAFGLCRSLTAFSVAEGNPGYSARDGILYTADRKTLLRYPLGKEISRSYTVPSVEAIGSSAFSDVALVSVTIPQSVKSIGTSAFAWCRELESVQLHAGLEIVSNLAFSYCERLSALELPNTVRSLGISVFLGCNRLSAMHLPYKLKQVYPESFGTRTLTTLYVYHDSYPAVFGYYYGYRVKELGDLDGSGVLDTADACRIMREYSLNILGKGSFTAEQKRLADVNCDGVIDTNDAVQVLRYYGNSMLGKSDWNRILG